MNKKQSWYIRDAQYVTHTENRSIGIFAENVNNLFYYISAGIFRMKSADL